VLRTNYRNKAGVSVLAAAVREGDVDQTLAILGSGREDVHWCRAEEGAPITGRSDPRLLQVRRAAVAAGRDVVESAQAGDAAGALAALGSFRLLCAHRRGSAGAATWMANVEAWLEEGVDGFSAEGTWYAGRPLIMTANDYSLRLFNGDVGVIVAGPGGRLSAAFERGGEVIEVSTTRLAAVDTVYAMTVHKAQGSQFSAVAVVLPQPGSPILTRELLYTALTRAREEVTLIGDEAAIREAVLHPIARSSGLRRRIWEPAQ